MKKQTVIPIFMTFVFSLSCQFLIPTREGTMISDCTDIVTAVRNIQPSEIPQGLFDNGIKQGGEFDANDYFDVLTHVSMQEGYILDYVYSIDFLGSFPLLYAHPEGQPHYASMEDIPQNTDLADFRDHLEVEDVEQGYFEYVVMHMLAGQFYLYWHANYNDTEIVCSRSGVRAIISDVNAGNFGSTFDISQKAKARAMKNIEPLVQLGETTATVEILVFTKWGGFYRQTFTISRSFPHKIIDVKEENLVPYDCGVMF
jgi:hypothetical protein